MQEYLVSRNLGKSVEKEAVISDDAIHSFRRILGALRSRKRRRKKRKKSAERNSIGSLSSAEKLLEKRSAGR